MSTKLNIEKYIENVKNIHKNKYVYSNTIYTLSRNKINIICLSHGVFSLTANHHLKGIGCSKCTSSKGENKI